jgi:hypothetical protein
MEIKTLSSIPGISFNQMLEIFFDEHEVDEDIECYQLVFCPYGYGTSFEDLNEINFQSRVVILNLIDTIIDIEDNTDIVGLTEFCENHPEQNFIISSPHFNLQRELNKRGLDIPNLYLTNLAPTSIEEKWIHCEKKNLTNRWVSFNSSTKLHRVLAVCYLLSKDYHQNGAITFDMNSPIFVTHEQYKNIDKPPSYQLKSDLARGLVKFKSKDFNKLKLPKFNQEDLRVTYNYNTNLLPIYERIGLEIITGTTFFEGTPVLSEKEMQSVYGKNFPIYINGVGMAREMKNFFGVDVFEDVVDHSYDEIEDHFERLAAAFDRNQHLLNGSTNIRELWYDNQKRFEDNCVKMDNIVHDGEYQRLFNRQRIREALNHFNVTFTEK